MDQRAAVERKVDAKLVLRAYQLIVERGEREAEQHRLGELTAASDFDGYTVSVSDGRVTVRVLFHSRLDIDAPSARALEDYLTRLNRLVAA